MNTLERRYFLCLIFVLRSVIQLIVQNILNGIFIFGIKKLTTLELRCFYSSHGSGEISLYCSKKNLKKKLLNIFYKSWKKSWYVQYPTTFYYFDPYMNFCTDMMFKCIQYWFTRIKSIISLFSKKYLTIVRNKIFQKGLL